MARVGFHFIAPFASEREDIVLGGFAFEVQNEVSVAFGDLSVTDRVAFGAGFFEEFPGKDFSGDGIFEKASS